MREIYRTPTDIRFDTRIEKTDGCWWWIPRKGRDQYGVIRVGSDHPILPEGPISTHRYAYVRANGPIPAGHIVRHRCDNKACVNPDHLEVGTTADNAQDYVARTPNKYAPREYMRTRKCGSVEQIPAIIAMSNSGASWAAINRKYQISREGLAIALAAYAYGRSCNRTPIELP